MSYAVIMLKIWLFFLMTDSPLTSGVARLYLADKAKHDEIASEWTLRLEPTISRFARIEICSCNAAAILQVNYNNELFLVVDPNFAAKMRQLGIIEGKLAPYNESVRGYHLPLDCGRKDLRNLLRNKGWTFEGPRGLSVASGFSTSFWMNDQCWKSLKVQLLWLPNSSRIKDLGRVYRGQLTWFSDSSNSLGMRD
ncbi:hypothetical protein Gotri_006090 [Gossypium trilobum]|uniref:Uncharacterized protein n=1 Tax=Gossypium trilobum TaxID=34281 RepID=A0A7J9EYS7_9ROSI|nr:hypothetical protein [Gossypium trilobum]